MRVDTYNLVFQHNREVSTVCCIDLLRQAGVSECDNPRKGDMRQCWGGCVQGTDVTDEELLEYISESSTMSKAMDEYEGKSPFLQAGTRE